MTPKLPQSKGVPFYTRNSYPFSLERGFNALMSPFLDSRERSDYIH